MLNDRDSCKSCQAQFKLQHSFVVHSPHDPVSSSANNHFKHLETKPLSLQVCLPLITCLPETNNYSSFLLQKKQIHF
jgi:hypothetical protein